MIGLGFDKKVRKERKNLFARIVKASLVPTDLSLFWKHPVLIASLILPIVILIAFNQWWLGPGCGKGKVQLSCWDQFSWLLNQRTSPCCVYTKYIFGCWLMFLFIIAKKVDCLYPPQGLIFTFPLLYFWAPHWRGHHQAQRVRERHYPSTWPSFVAIWSWRRLTEVTIWKTCIADSFSALFAKIRLQSCLGRAQS